MFSIKPKRSLEFSVSPLRILFNQTHHVDDMTDANTHEQPQGRQHCLTPHLPSLEQALTASCFVCFVKVPLHILCQGHALPVGCLSCSSLAICRLCPAFKPLAHIPNKFFVCSTDKKKRKNSSNRSSLIIISKIVRGFIHACLSLKANEGGLH